jgi:hypothetical protein
MRVSRDLSPAMSSLSYLNYLTLADVYAGSLIHILPERDRTKKITTQPGSQLNLSAPDPTEVMITAGCLQMVKLAKDRMIP